MAIRRRIASPVVVLLSAFVGGIAGCNHGLQPNPYAQPPYGNPWAAPYPTEAPAGTTLPPPPGQQTPVPAYPAAPSLPPPQGSVAPQQPLPANPYSGVQGPNWNNPGTLSQQQQQATVFDPFASNEAGPEIVGGRPRDFQKPMTEATRAQGFRNTRIPF
jgi:hypothetical protein